MWDEGLAPNEWFYLLADPSKGIRDPQGHHDPAGMHGIARRAKRLVARHVDYTKPYDLGALMVRTAVHLGYERCKFVPEINYEGEALLIGIQQEADRLGLPPPDIFVQIHHDKRKGVSSRELGWVTTHKSRGTALSALMRAVKHDLMDVPSAAAVTCLSNMIYGPDGKPEAAPGEHDEDGYPLLAVAAHLLETDPVPEDAPERLTPVERLERDLGFDIQPAAISDESPDFVL